MNTRSFTLGKLPSFACLMASLLSSAAYAETLTYSVPFHLSGYTDGVSSSTDVSLGEFPTRLGKLTGVMFTLASDISALSRFDAPDPSPFNFVLSGGLATNIATGMGAELRMEGGGGDGGAGFYDDYGPHGIPMFVATPVSVLPQVNQYQLAAADWRGWSSATDRVHGVELTSSLSLSSVSDTRYFWGWGSPYDLPGTLTVAYTYTPAVPEPQSAWLLIIGAVCLTLRGMRAARI